MRITSRVNCNEKCRGARPLDEVDRAVQSSMLQIAAKPDYLASPDGAADPPRASHGQAATVLAFAAARLQGAAVPDRRGDLEIALP